MTAAEAAAALAGAKANTSGVFSLDQLKALGQTGNQAADWAKSGAAPGLIAGGGNASLNATAMGLKAGYYQLPNATQAEYFDPASGHASAEMVAWANSLTPEQLDPSGQPTSGFIAAEGGPQAEFSARADQSAQDVATQNAIIAGGKGADGTYQDSQDRILGLGKYQQFMLGANGEQLRVGAPLASKPLYQDVSPGKSGMFKLVAPPGGNGQSQWQAADGSAVPYSKVAADIKTQMDALGQHNYDAWHGLQQERIARGEDPMTGVSAAETQKIYDTYSRIQDPAEKAAYIRAQDPGNLTAGLRVARGEARQGEQNWMTKNALAPVTTIESSAAYGDKSGLGGGAKTTYGDVTQTDSKTGRSIMFGNVPVAREYIAPSGKGSFDSAMHRIGGAVYGAFIGYIGSFGSPVGAVTGAIGGSGALGGISLKKPGKTHWGESQKPGDIQGIALSLGEAMLFSKFGGQYMGRVGHAAFGAGFGTVNGFLAGGEKGAVQGGIFGGISGYTNKGGAVQQSWADKQYGVSFNSTGTAVR